MWDKQRVKRKKVQRVYLERRLYKTERRIERFSKEANLLRQTIKIMYEREAKRKVDILSSKEVMTAAVEANKKIEEGYNASNREKWCKKR